MRVSPRIGGRAQPPAITAHLDVSSSVGILPGIARDGGRGKPRPALGGARGRQPPRHSGLVGGPGDTRETPVAAGYGSNPGRPYHGYPLCNVAAGNGNQGPFSAGRVDFRRREPGLIYDVLDRQIARLPRAWHGCPGAEERPHDASIAEQ